MYANSIQVSTPGKLILLGEYAVLEHAPCLVSAVQRECTVDVKPDESPWFSINSSRSEVPNVECMFTPEGGFQFKESLSADGHKRLRFVLSTLKYVVQQVDSNIGGASIFINTDRFFHQPSEQKLGLGASAAITVSLLAALMKFVDRPMTERELYKQAFQIHRQAQGGVGSGMDIAASATGGVIEYQMQTDPSAGGIIKPVDWPESLRMISIWAGHSASTQNMVQQVRAFQHDNPDRYDAIMKPMKELTRSGCEAFKSGNTDEFLEIVSDYVNQEQKLGEASEADIISEVHRKIGSIVKKAGGSYKPSGAGGGDIGVAFCNSDEAYLNIQKAIEESRFDVLDLPLQTGEPA